MKIVIRTDASATIGSGHVMRCLTLADALRERGAEVRFICRAHEGNLVGLVRGKQYNCALLDSPAAGALWRRDAEETAHVVQQTKTCDWLIVDHYSLDRHWEAAMRPYAKKIMVIDDLANREHDCDLLLDCVCNRQQEDYRPLSPPSCRFLLGAAYTLLRPEFAELRPATLARREKTTEIRNLLVTLGGADPDNLTGAVLRQLSAADLPDDIAIDVILGAAFSRRAEIEKVAANLPVRTGVSVAVNDMAERISRADMAVGAGGGSVWERCCLGLPSITIVAAENQLANAAALEQERIGITLRHGHWANDFHSALQQTLHDRQWRRQTASRGSRLVDGQGAGRVAEALKKLQ